MESSVQQTLIGLLEPTSKADYAPSLSVVSKELPLVPRMTSVKI